MLYVGFAVRCHSQVATRFLVCTMNQLKPLTARRSQNERSEQMRQRLVDAVLESLQSHGYAGTTISRIIDIAGVSRGAPLHHFATKAELIEAAAQQLVRRIYKEFNQAIQQLKPSENTLEDFILTAWQVVTAQPDSIAFSELLLESQRDQNLAAILQKLWTNIYLSLEAFAGLHLKPVAPGENVKQLMVLTQWVLRGMAADKHLIEDQGLIHHYIKLWSSLMSQHIQPQQR